jgi:hypothetical protein
MGDCNSIYTQACFIWLGHRLRYQPCNRLQYCVHWYTNSNTLIPSSVEKRSSKVEVQEIFCRLWSRTVTNEWSFGFGIAWYETSKQHTTGEGWHSKIQPSDSEYVKPTTWFHMVNIFSLNLNLYLEL